MTTWKNFLIRALSAIAALAIVFALYNFWNINGLKFIILFSVIVGTWELKNLLFKNEPSIFLKIAFFILTLMTFGVSSYALSAGLLVFMVSHILLWTLSLISLHNTGQLTRITDFQSKSALGIVYMGLSPAFILRILDLPQGLNWFIYLLGVVFSGDTFAYIFGILFGKNKIMPFVSPKKTWQGSLGGILGSLLAGFICWKTLLPEINLSATLILAAISGFVGQFGDFFESLLKRVADVKDSGRIMPGHGGVLDRIDGILFAGPVVLFGVLIFSHLLS